MDVEIMETIRKLKHLFVFLLSGTVFLSCNSADYSSSIDLTKKHSVSVFDVFSDVKVIELETSENTLISEIRKVKYYDSRYYIMDVRSQQIFCFYEDGRFAYKIDAQGRGKGEYHYMQDFSIDVKNEKMLVLDPVVQRVHFFDLKGNFLRSYDINSDNVLGLIRVYPFQDSILLLVSMTHENLQFYSLKEEKIIYSHFSHDLPSTLHAFDPIDHVYMFEDKVLFLVPLSREIVDISAMVPEPYFAWCFGEQNNTDQQINRLLEEIKIKQQIPEYITLPYNVVGKNKILNHQIMKSFENERFRIAAIEFDDDFHFVVIDKTENHTVIFNSFKEGILLPFKFMQSDRAIAYYEPETSPEEIRMMEKRGMLEYYVSRNFKMYLPEIFHEDCRKIVENHNPMTDNPFLVIYRFKE